MDREQLKQNVFMDVARTISDLATCKRARVGAVIVKDGKIVGTGYNGAPSGLPHCEEVGCLKRDEHCVRCEHAESNAILNAIVQDLRGATIYCTYQPCLSCMRKIIQKGITQVLYDHSYTDAEALDFAKEAGVTVTRLLDVSP